MSRLFELKNRLMMIRTQRTIKLDKKDDTSRIEEKQIKKMIRELQTDGVLKTSLSRKYRNMEKIIKQMAEEQARMKDLSSEELSSDEQSQLDQSKDCQSKNCDGSKEDCEVKNCETQKCETQNCETQKCEAEKSKDCKQSNQDCKTKKCEAEKSEKDIGSCDIQKDEQCSEKAENNLGGENEDN